MKSTATANSDDDKIVETSRGQVLADYEKRKACNFFLHFPVMCQTFIISYFYFDVCRKNGTLMLKLLPVPETLSYMGYLEVSLPVFSTSSNQVRSEYQLK